MTFTMLRNSPYSLILCLLISLSFTSIQGQSFINISLVTPGNAGYLSENCGGPYQLLLERTPGNEDTILVTIDFIGGGAVYGEDYFFSPDPFPLILLPGQNQILLDIIVIDDGIPESFEGVAWNFNYTNGTNSATLHLKTGVIDAYAIEFTLDTIRTCRGSNYSFGGFANGNWNYILETPGKDTTSGWYFATVGTDTCGAKDSVYLDLYYGDIAADTLYICKDGEGVMLPGSVTKEPVSFKWIPSDSTLSDTNSLTPIANPKVTTTYILEVNYLIPPGLHFPCTSYDTVVVRVDSIPPDLHIDIAPMKPYYCAGEVVALFSASFDSLAYPDLLFDWRPDDGTFLTRDSILNASLQLLDTTLYIRDVFNNACISHDSILINVVPPGIPLSVTDTMLCPGQSFQVNVLSNQITDPEWTPEDGLSCSKCLDPNVTVIGLPGTTQVYSFSGKILECPVGANLTIHIPPVQFINVTGDEIVCEGDMVPLTITNPENLADIQWSVTFGDATLSCTNCLSPTVTVLGSGPINISLSANTTNLNFCGAAGFIQLRHGEEPVVQGPDIQVCVGGSVVASTGFPNFTNVQWEVFTGNLSLSCNACPNPTVMVNDTGTLRFFAEVNHPDTCGITGYVHVSTEQIQLVGPPVQACLGETVVATTGNPNLGNVHWDVISGDISINCDNCAAPEVTVNGSGLLRFMADQFVPDTCQVTGSVSVIALIAPDISNLIADPDPMMTDIGQGSEVMVTLNVNEAPPTSIMWTVNGVSIPGTTSAIAFNANEENNLVVVTFTNSKGCTQTDTINIPTVPPSFQIPNAFTPNEDDINDNFKIIINGNINIEEFLIFNRWGQLVYEAPEGDLEGWDGKFKGEKAASDTYVYKAALSYPNGRAEIAKGDVMLIR